MKFSLPVTLLFTYLASTASKSAPSAPKASPAASSSAASSASSSSPKISSTSQVAQVLGDGGELVDHNGPTTWWGIPLDRLPGMEEDIAMLNGLLEEIAESEDSATHAKYRELLKLGEDRANGVEQCLPKMVKTAQSLSSSEMLNIARLFTHSLNLVNIAEMHHRFRILKGEEKSGKITEDCLEGTLAMIGDSASADEIYEQLLKQQVEIVFTAHPTEVNRRTMLMKHRKISESLGILDDPELNSFQKRETEASVRRTIASLWGSDEIRRSKPTPTQEAAGGIAIIESVLWDAFPAFCRKLDDVVENKLNKKLPPDVVPVKFASWIGGDRDGNPNVTPLVTREVVMTLRLRAAKLLEEDLQGLYDDIAISKSYSPEMLALSSMIIGSNDSIEKYRRVLGHLKLRMSATVKFCEDSLQKIKEGKPFDYAKIVSPRQQAEVYDDNNPQPIFHRSELKDPLMTMYQSLTSTGYSEVADGALKDLLRKFSAFGLTLTPLDIREESDKHTAALDAVTKSLGIGSYESWDEKTRINWLNNELSNKRPLFRIRDVANMDYPESVVKTLQTFEMASTLGSGSTGAYVISQARTASDVLAVMLLQKQFGMTSENGRMMRVVPLFETLTDLENAPDVVDTLFSSDQYLGAVKGVQEIMVGYSDSAKDAGRLAACWAQYTAQEKVSAVAQKYGVELTFFHGKGGTVGRGGNPSVYRAVLAHPPNTINGRFRVTEQGEMITQNFGDVAQAKRTLDIYTSAVLRESFVKHVEPTDDWRAEMADLSKVSCDAYRQLVRKEPRFVPYFRQATPELELGTLNIGSRPAKRNPKGGIESLRAIPWTFAWTQTRVHLSAWLGCGEALNPDDEEKQKKLKNMYNSWPWFRETIDLISMVLSKSDMSINANYDAQLVDKTDELLSLGKEIRNRLAQTRSGVLKVTGCEDVTAGFHLLQESMKTRAAFVDPINCIQAEVMKRYRALEKKGDKLTKAEKVEKEILVDGLRVCISGIAQGMRNSG
ncbi:hypothetical protein TrLO_g13459 [Triparma laevis f. longispina]|uniref:phosphoenolpyruvate carboxylase n=1 Tax=Triparma laevis f. longispina TaxID=1714387 RepID=A0A9W7FV65_9STRA|nr:hypothetical protein TrLO_g13459 [Triparma laevis f. longispina]